ncbi:hypothetical protein AB6D66_25445 [Vibrio pomeroyi]|uniref:Glycosyltransferase RgtA/B/C/D-like domain-containing protein n=1 Tax=Vibrio pomeroyi TaxID=198832 RepID=A0ABV4N5L1_9VIBR
MKNHIQFKYSETICKVVFYSIFLFMLYAYYTRNHLYSVDDSFITFKYAINFIQGNGLVFNVDENYFGTTAGGYAILIAFVYKIQSLFDLGLTVQNSSVLLSTLGLAAVSILFVSFIRFDNRINTWLLSILVILFIPTLWVFNSAAGHETYTYLGLVSISLLLFRKGETSILFSGLVLGIAFTVRPDAALFAPIMCLTYVFQNKLHIKRWLRTVDLWLFSIGFFLIALPWLSFTTLYFGIPFPGTMDAKIAQVDMGYWPLYDAQTLFNSIIRNLPNWLVCLVLIGSVYFSFKSTRPRTQLSERTQFIAVVWFLFAVLSSSFYFYLNVTYWEWYGIPIMLGLMVLGWVGVYYLLADILPKVSSSSLSFVLLSCLLFFQFGSVYSWAKTENYNPHIYAYTEVADYLLATEPEGTTIQMAEPGSFSFQLGPKYKIIDELGLISPLVAKELREKNYTFSNENFQAKYIVCSWGGVYSACDHPDIMVNYALIGEFNKDFWEPRIGRGSRLYKINEDD